MDDLTIILDDLDDIDDTIINSVRYRLSKMTLSSLCDLDKCQRYLYRRQQHQPADVIPGAMSAYDNYLLFARGMRALHYGV